MLLFRLNASLSTIRERTVSSSELEERKVAEVLVRKVPENQQVPTFNLVRNPNSKPSI